MTVEREVAQSRQLARLIEENKYLREQIAGLNLMMIEDATEGIMDMNYWRDRALKAEKETVVTYPHPRCDHCGEFYGEAPGAK